MLGAASEVGKEGKKRQSATQLNVITSRTSRDVERRSCDCIGYGIIYLLYDVVNFSIYT